MVEKTRQKKRGSPLYPGMWECVGQIPAKLGRDEKLLNKKSGKPSQNWDYTISDGGYSQPLCTIEFLECMTLYIVWVHMLYDVKQNSCGNWTINYDIRYRTTLPLCCTIFFKYLYCMHYMILMSERMTSQKKLGEIKSVP